MPERVLVTGGAGYIGSVVAAELLRAGYGVVVLDDLSHGHRAAVPRGAEFMHGRVDDAALLAQVFDQHNITAVLHFAALIEAGESMRSPEKYFRGNTATTLALLEAMLAHGVRKLVFSSTAAVYGEPPHSERKITPITEDAPLAPTNPYGESKLMVERMLAWFHRIHGLRYASLRYFNAAGAMAELGEDHRPESHLIPLVLDVAAGKRDAISIYGDDYPTSDGTCVRDYIHVQDLAAAHVLALQALATRDHLICNLGNGRGFSVREVIEAARRVTGREIVAHVAPRRAGDPAVLVAGSERIRNELKWQPRFASLQQIIASAWEWKQRHPRGYEDNLTA